LNDFPQAQVATSDIGVLLGTGGRHTESADYFVCGSATSGLSPARVALAR
jgi:hypothetical protein